MEAKINTLKRIQIPNRKIKNCAEQFKDAVKLLCSQPAGSGLVLPLITNAVFAIELYLKALNAQVIIADNKVSAEVNCQGHSLTTLFESLDKGVKKELGFCYKKSGVFSVHAQLGAVLKKYNNLYIKARYSFERDKRISGVSLTELIKLVNFFHNFVFSLPDREYIETKT